MRRLWYAVRLAFLLPVVLTVLLFLWLSELRAPKCSREAAGYRCRLDGSCCERGRR